MYTFECDEEFDFKVPNLNIRYSKLVNSSKINIIYIKDAMDPTFRYRGLNVIQSMENNNKYNVNFFFADELDVLYEILDKVTLVIIQRTKWTFEVENFIKVLKFNNITVLFDIDDLIYDSKYVPGYLNSTGDYNENNITQLFSISKRYGLLAEMCDGIIVTTDFLKDKAENDFKKPVWVFHNYLNKEQERVSEKIIKLKEKTYSDKKFIIGYFSGSPSHKRDLEIVESALLKLMDKYDDIYLKIVGYMSLPFELIKYKHDGRIDMVNLVSFQELQYEIGQVDLNIIPLQKHEFNECKSELKYFESAVVNTLTCATDNSLYKNMINDGVDGFLSDELSWFDKIEYIYLNRDNFDEVAENARVKCYGIYGNSNQEKNLEKMFDDIIYK